MGCCCGETFEKACVLNDVTVLEKDQDVGPPC